MSAVAFAPSMIAPAPVALIAHNPLSRLVHVAIETTKVPTVMTQTRYVQEIVTVQEPDGSQIREVQERPVLETVAAVEVTKTLVITSHLLKAKGGSVSFVISDKVVPVP